MVKTPIHCEYWLMYSSDLDLITKSRLTATGDVALAQRTTRRLPRWLRRLTRR